jgi:hypothetical protein
MINRLRKINFRALGEAAKILLIVTGAMALGIWLPLQPWWAIAFGLAVEFLALSMLYLLEVGKVKAVAGKFYPQQEPPPYEPNAKFIPLAWRP